MSGKIYDDNFLKNEKADDSSTDWYSVTYDTMDLYGAVRENDCVLTRRIPLNIAEKISVGVAGQSGYGAGVRLLFSTDSPDVSLRVEYADGAVPTVCNHCFCYGFDLYKWNDAGKYVFCSAFRPADKFDYKSAEYKKGSYSDGKMSHYVLNMPHFAGVKKLDIGIDKGYHINPGMKYRNHKPIVFYGSSITHGGAAGRPGNTYENFISQKYNLDYVNLGFAGNAKGERKMAEYISGLDMCMFVCDYDHNAPDVAHLENTHFKFYETIRQTHPDIPYIMISKPDFFTNPKSNAERRSVIIKSYEKAKSNGDKNVYFIDGETLFDGEFYESCTSDGCHPNDLGFYRMSCKIGDVIAEILEIL